MPLPNGRNVSAKPGRSKSTSAATGKLPPVVSQETREQTEAIKKAINRPKTAHQKSRPPTSSYALPSFAHGRLPTATKNLKLAMKRSNSETRALPKIEYGRSASREQLTDLRDELFEAKKKVAGYETDLKKLGTEMQRLKRDAEKRETFLERIVTAQYHPTELNDTHLARTLTSIKKKEIEKKNLIEIQSRELDRLRTLLKDGPPPLKHPVQSMEIVPESMVNLDDDEAESDYPEEPDQVEANGLSLKDDEFDEVFEAAAKKDSKPRDKSASKERNELAKRYVEQNAQLKQKLREMKTNYASIVEKHRKKGEEFQKQAENSKAVVEKTVEITNALDSLQKERENLSEIRKQNELKIDNLNQELIEAYGEIDALKMHNEMLQENMRDMRDRMGHMEIQSDYESHPPLNIPRLDMTDIDIDENCTLHEFTERSVSTTISEYDHDLLAGVLAEIAGAHYDNLIVVHMNFDCDYNNKSSSRYHHSESCTKLNYVYTSRQCDEYFEYLEELRRIIFGQRFPAEMSSASTHSRNSNSIHYHTQNGKTLVYNIEDATDYGITLSPISSQTETLVTETFYAEEHVLVRTETSQIIHPKLCHQLPSIEERMRNCLHSSSEVINSHLSDSRELLHSTPMPCNDYSIHDHASRESYPAEKEQSDYNFHDYSEDDQDFNDLSSLSDGVNASFAVIEDFAKVLEETGSVFEELDCEGFDDQWSISDDKARRIVGIVKRHNEQLSWDPEKVSSLEVIECPHPTIHYAEKTCPDEYMEELLSEKISFEKDLQLPSIFNSRSPNSATFTAIDRSPPNPILRKSSGNTSPSSETETSNGSVLVNMIQDYVKMVMDVSLTLSQPAQAEAPEGSVSGFSPVSNVVGKREESGTMYTSQTEIENEGSENTYDCGGFGQRNISALNLKKSERKHHEDVSTGEQFLTEVQRTDQMRNVEIEKNPEPSKIDGNEDNSYEDLKLGPIGPRSSSVEKWESVTLRAQRLNSGEQAEKRCEEPELDAATLIDSSYYETCSPAKTVSEEEQRTDILSTSLHASDFNCTLPSGFVFDAVVRRPSLDGNETAERSEPIPVPEKQTNITHAAASKECIEVVHAFENTKPSGIEDLPETHFSLSDRAELATFHENDHCSNDTKLDVDEHYDESGIDNTDCSILSSESEEGFHEIFDKNVKRSGDDYVIGRIRDDSEVSEKGCEQETRSTDDKADFHGEPAKLIAPHDGKEYSEFFRVNQPEDNDEDIPKPDNDPCHSPASIAFDIANSAQVFTIPQHPANGAVAASLLDHNGSNSVQEDEDWAYLSDKVESEPLPSENSILLDTFSPINSNSVDGHSKVNFTQEKNASSVDTQFSSNILSISSQSVLKEKTASTNEIPTANSSNLEFDSSEEMENTVLAVLNEMMKQLGSIDALEGNDAEEENFETDSILQKDLRSYLVSDQFPESATHTETDFREKHNPLSTPFQNLPNINMTEFFDQDDSDIFSENISQAGNDQETDTEIAGALDYLLTSVFPEPDHVSCVENGTLYEQKEEPDLKEEPEESEARSVVNEEESIGAAGQPTLDFQHQSIFDVLEHCLHVLEALEYLTQTVSSHTDDAICDSLTEDFVFNDSFNHNISPYSSDASVVHRVSDDSTQSTPENHESTTVEKSIDINPAHANHLAVISNDLFLSVQKQNTFQKENVEDGPMDVSENKKTVYKERNTIWLEEGEPIESNFGNPQFSEDYSDILTGRVETEDIVDVIISVVCVVEVAEAMMNEVVKLLETVSSAAGNNVEDQSRIAISLNVDDPKPDLPIQNECKLEFKPKDWSEKEFSVAESDEEMAKDVKECLAFIVSVVEVVDALLRASMSFEYESEEVQIEFEFVPKTLAEKDLSNHTNLSQAERDISTTMEIVEPAPLKLLQSQELQQPDLQLSDTREEMDQVTFTLDQILSVVEVVQDFLNEVMKLEASVVFADSHVSEVVPLKVVSVDSNFPEINDLQRVSILGENVSEQGKPIKVHIQEYMDQRKQVVCLDPSLNSPAEQQQDEVLKPEIMQQSTEEVDTPCSLEPIVKNCEIFLNSMLEKTEHEPEQEECSVITSETSEVYESFEPSPNLSHIDEHHLCYENSDGREATDFYSITGIPHDASCESSSSVLETMFAKQPDNRGELLQPTAEVSISEYVKQLVDQQLFDAMNSASHLIAVHTFTFDNTARGEFHQDHQLIQENSEKQSVHSSRLLGDISDKDSCDNLPSNHTFLKHEENCDDCFEEVADANQNFSTATPGLEQLQNTFSAIHEAHVQQTHEVLTEATIVSSPLPSHTISDCTHSPEQTEVLTASESLVSEISEDGNDDVDRSSNETSKTTGTCQQLQLERAQPTQPPQNLDDAIYRGFDLVPESSDCSLCVDLCDPVPTNSSQKLSPETSSPESSLKSLEQPTTSSVLEEVSHFLTTACVAALVYMSPRDSYSDSFNTDHIEDASKYISSEPEPRQDGQS